MAATKKDVEDFNFIIKDSIRLSKLLNQSSDLYAKEFDSKIDQILSSINVPIDIYEKDDKQTYFQLHLSSKAQRRLSEITARQIKQNNLVHELTLNEYISDIRDSLYIHILKNNNFDLSGCSVLLSRAYKRAKKKMTEVTYFFPLQANNINPYKDIQIGPVKITHKDNVYPNIKDKQQLNDFISNDKHFEFNSLLCIAIPKCSADISKKRAENVADFVYGVIKVFAVSYSLETKQLVLNKNPIINNPSHYIAYEKNVYYVSGIYSFPEDLQEFWVNFEKDLSLDLGMIVKQLIEYAICPTPTACLSDRLIDAFLWFGDASRDNNKNSQVVKLTTAMERLVTLSIEKNDSSLTNRFCSRVSCSIACFHDDIDFWRLEAKKIYELRSVLVHGTRNIHKSYDSPLNFNPFRLACYTILSSCIGFYKLGLDSTNYEIKLQAMYKQLSEYFLNNRTI